MPPRSPAATPNTPGAGLNLAAFPKGFFEQLVRREMTLSDWIGLAGSLDLDGIELHPAFFDTFEPAELLRLRREAEARGLQVPMLCHSPDFTQADASLRTAEVRRTIDMIRVTSELGGRHCRVLSGQDRPGLVEAQALGWVIGCLEDLVPHAEAAGVVLCLENHYKDNLWQYAEFAQSHARYLAILDAVDSPWLAVQYDPSNAIVAGEDQYALLERVLPRVATVHASDRHMQTEGGQQPRLVHGVVGQGLNDYGRIFAMLAGAGFAGWISIEDGEGPTIETGMDNLRDSVRFIRTCLP